MTEPRGTRITGGRLLTCEDTSVVDDGVVVADGDRIAWVGPVEALPPEYASEEFEVIDASGMTVMPGLVDGHMHISFGQAATDVRALVQHLIDVQGVRQVGLLGLSLGGYVAALVASLEPRLAFCVPVAAPASIADLLWRQTSRT